jgi:hypothetical protein
MGVLAVGLWCLKRSGCAPVIGGDEVSEIFWTVLDT